MHPGEIKSALAMARTTQRQLAREVDVKETVVSAVVNGKARSARIEQRISEITDIPLYRLWPQWHEAPEGVPEDFDPTRISVDLLEAVERSLVAELRQRIPGLGKPLSVRARHRAAVYNACLKRGTAAIETGAGTTKEVLKYLDTWAIDFEQATGDKPTAADLKRWALTQDSSNAPSPDAAAKDQVINAPGGVGDARGATIRQKNVVASGPGAIAAGKGVHYHGKPKPRKK